jgi:hypothetical protein
MAYKLAWVMAARLLHWQAGLKRMSVRYSWSTLGAAVLAVSLNAQPIAEAVERRAIIREGGSDRGKCTIEVVVDGSAEVEIRGDRAVLRNLAGRPPEWRRFECNSVMPANPAEFRFRGINGRGRQNLVREPRGEGPAVVRIDDPQNGSGGYTFDITWANGGVLPPVPPPVERGPAEVKTSGVGL